MGRIEFPGSNDSTVLQIVGKLYERLEESDGWDTALLDLAEVLQGAALCVHRYDLGCRNGETIQTLRGLNEEDAKEYRDHHAPTNTWMARLTDVPQPAEVLVSHKLCSEDELIRQPFYNEFLKPRGLSAMMAVILHSRRNVIVSVNVLRGLQPGRFRESEERLMRSIAPHLQNAHRMEWLLDTSRNQGAILEDVLDRLHTGVFALSADLRVMVSNESAEKLIARSECVSVSHGRIQFRDRAAQQALVESVSGFAVASKCGGAAAGVSFPISRPSLACPYSATVLPLRPLIPAQNHRGACCLLLLEDPDRRDAPPESRLRQVWGLTPAEARVAALLASDNSLREVSSELGITYNTARSHLQMIFLKTGTSSQGELMSLLNRFGMTVSDGTGIEAD